MSADSMELIRNLFASELERLRDQVRELCQPLSDQEFWKRPLEPGNSIGHLVLHVSGNLNHFIGAQLGGTGYIRDREREFTEKELPSKSQALDQLDEAVGVFRKVVAGLDGPQLEAAHPEKRFGTVLTALMQITTHFALHRGQMSYIARLAKQ